LRTIRILQNAVVKKCIKKLRKSVSNLHILNMLDLWKRKSRVMIFAVGNNTINMGEII
jgi:hypothetical protein